jgi:hypothetical protein
VKKWICLVFLFLLFWINRVTGQPTSVISQSIANEPFFRITSQNGKILQQNRPFLMSLDANGQGFKYFVGASAEFGWNLMGRKQWHQINRFPRFGFGAQYFRILNRDDLGHPLSFYGFYDGNYMRTANFELTSRLSVGAEYGFTVYNAADSLPNDIFCTRFNYFIELGFGAAFRVSKLVYLEPGFRLTHFSNGNIKEPQKGLNNISLTLGVRQFLREEPRQPFVSSIDTPRRKHELEVFLAMCSRQVEFETYTGGLHETYDINYLMANMHFGYNYYFSRRWKLSGGINLLYDGKNGQHEFAYWRKPQRNDVPLNHKIGLAVFAGTETEIGKITVVAHFGYTLAGKRLHHSAPRFAQRLGVRYALTNHVFAGMHVRSYKFRAAEAVEYNIGYRYFIE